MQFEKNLYIQLCCTCLSSELNFIQLIFYTIYAVHHTVEMIPVRWGGGGGKEGRGGGWEASSHLIKSAAVAQIIPSSYELVISSPLNLFLDEILSQYENDSYVCSRVRTIIYATCILHY